MKRHTGFYFLVFACLVGCAGSGPRLREIVELAPPTSVSWTKQEGSVVLQWQPSPQEASADFAGYNVYISEYSLLFTPPSDLPPVILLGKEHRYLLLSGSQKSRAVFIHIRSRDQRGDISLPSLPEITLAAD